jgi:hypothetical protein
MQAWGDESGMIRTGLPVLAPSGAYLETRIYAKET